MDSLKFAPQDFKFHTPVKLGRGDALRRVLMLHGKLISGVITSVERQELKDIYEAMNVETLDLGFDCNEDGIPDTIEIFEKNVKTSCCRRVPLKKTTRKTSSSRRKKR